MAFLLGIIILVVGLIISIGLHECGHLLPAKKFGALVPQFMIGFGPTLFSRKRGETEYGVKAILLGGYCRILGMYGPGDPDQFGYKLDGKNFRCARHAPWIRSRPKTWFLPGRRKRAMPR